MRRREFFKLVGGIAAGWPLAALAQQQAGKLPRIGFISTEPSELTKSLNQGLRQAGYVDGQNIILDTRYHHGSLERIDEFARELVALKCSILVTGSPYAIRAVLKETNTIPTVGIDLESDPVANGWVKSLARPGGQLDRPFSGYSRIGRQTN
jgi:putative tryptophan/tyrosine transport system substrate-binding protein